MISESWTWKDAREIEENLTSRIESALREGGVAEHLIKEIMAGRVCDPAPIRPVTERKIEYETEESRRTADRMGLKIPGLNAPMKSE